MSLRLTGGICNGEEPENFSSLSFAFLRHWPVATPSHRPITLPGLHSQ